MSNIMSFSDGEIIDLHTVDGAYKHVGRFLREHGATGDIFSSLERCKDKNGKERLLKMLEAALPHIECRNQEQSGLISAIGKCLEDFATDPN